MKYLRPVLIFAIIVLPIWVAGRHVPHHGGGSPLETLYMHLMPADLLSSEAMHASDGHDHDHSSDTADQLAAHAGELTGSDQYLLGFTAPGVPAFFDMDKEWVGTQLVATNLQLFQVAAVLLLLVCLQGVPRYLRTGQGDYTSRLFAGFVLWLREEVVYPVMGPETGRKFLPLFFFMFFFILFMNMMGLLPGSATATANVWVTGALASVILGSMLVCGMVAQGPFAYWKNLVPHVPLALWPILFVVELMGVFIKPLALCIRLFANMTGGHLAVLSLMGLIFVFAQMNAPPGELNTGIGWGVAPFAVAFTVFVMIIEFFVAMLQAFIFTQLSVIFIQSSVHPDH